MHHLFFLEVVLLIHLRQNKQIVSQEDVLQVIQQEEIFHLLRIQIFAP